MKKNNKIRIVLALLLSISLLGGFESLVFANSNKPIDLGVSDVIITDENYIVDGEQSGIHLRTQKTDCLPTTYQVSTCKYVGIPFSFSPYVSKDSVYLADITNQLVYRNTMKTALKKRNIQIKGYPHEKTITTNCSFLANKSVICTVTFKMDENNFFQTIAGKTNLSKATYQLKIPVCPIPRYTTQSTSAIMNNCKQNFTKILSQPIQKKPAVPTKNKTLKPVVIKKK